MASTEGATAIALWPPDGVAGSDAPRLTPFLLPAGTIAGAVIVCPGGGYSGRAAHEGAPVARRLNDMGIHAFVLDYRVAPHRHPVPFGDAQRALRTVRSRAEEWGIRPDRVAVLGFSAGGHLAATVGTHFDSGDPEDADPVERQSSRPDALVLCYPVITFGEFRHNGSMRNLLGEAPSEDLRRELSCELQVREDTPPTFLWHTADDASVPVENALLFSAALRRHRIPFALHIFPQGRHGLGLALDDSEVGMWSELCGRWLKALGYAAARSF